RVEFESETLRAGPLAAGFDFGAGAVFAWIGVTMYLTLAAIEATLETVAACPPGSRIVLTHNPPPSAARPGTRDAQQNVAARRRARRALDHLLPTGRGRGA